MARIGDGVKAVLKFMFVDSVVNILGDLFEQSIVTRVFIGWGWLSMLVMLTSIIETIRQTGQL